MGWTRFGQGKTIYLKGGSGANWNGILKKKQSVQDSDKTSVETGGERVDLEYEN